MNDRPTPSAATDAAPGRRQGLSLDGDWDFRLEAEAAWRTIPVPGPWQAFFDDLRDSTGTAVYRRILAIPEAWAGREVALCFGAVNYLAEVALDDAVFGRHEGGYLPFEIVLPAAAGAGEHALTVRVTLPDNRHHPEHPYIEIPHGKQSWYGPLGGIWQSVRLEARDPLHLRNCRLGPDLATGRVEAAVRLSRAAPPGATLAARVLDPDGAAAAAIEVALAPGAETAVLSLAVDRPRPWSPQAPHLYRLELTLAAAGGPVDRREETFGFRTIEARDGRLWLNGEVLYLRGALDQDYYPDGICTPPSVEFLEDQLRKAKAMGLNCLRCHIKVPDPRYHEVADRLGMLVWAELPNFEWFSAKAAARGRATLEGILERDGNHPSIVAWTILNEDWGTMLPENPDHREWLLAMYRWLKRLDPTRLVVDNSPCFPNFHMQTDIDDFHYYRGIPDRREEWDWLTRDFAHRADWSFSRHGDARRTGREPLVVSEFGVWGLPHLARLRDADGGEPWWAETGFNWADGTAYPHGVETRVRTLKLDRVFGGFDAFIEACQWQQYRALKYEIETMRRYASISGYVITELTDVHWEANGLMDLRRNPRVFADDLAAVNADTVIVPGLTRWAYWAGEDLAIAPLVAHGAGPALEGGVLEWSVVAGAAGRVVVGPLAAGTVQALAPLPIAAPAVTRPEVARLQFVLRGPDGAVLARNAAEVSVFPRPDPDAAAAPAVWTEDRDLAGRLQALGCELARRPARSTVLVVRRLDAGLVEAIRQGARVLLLADAAGKLPLRADAPLFRVPRYPGEGEADVETPTRRSMSPEAQVRRQGPFADDPAGDPRFPGIRVAARDGTIWRGDWVGTFTWLRRDGAFADIPGGPLLDLAFDRVVPHHVLVGFKPWEFETRVQAGLVVGWAHKPAVVVGERPFGAGNLVMTTFRLTRDPPGADPMATRLLHVLIRHAAGEPR